MNVLVTGGAGFIGSHLVETLLRRADSPDPLGRIERVVVLDNLDPFYAPAMKRQTLAQLKSIARPGQLEVLEGDITRPDDVERAFAAVSAGRSSNDAPAVVHLAGKAGVRPSLEQPALYARVNVEGTAVMLEAARRHAVSRFVFASSSSVYGARNQTPFVETDPVDRPVSPYAATKVAGELLCAVHSHLYQVPAVALRFFTVYGPRQRPDLAIAKFTRLIDRGEPLPRFGDGSTARDYTEVRDTVRGILAALSKSWPHFEVINLGGERPVTLSALVSGLESALGKAAQVVAHPEQPGDVPITCASPVKAERLLGWKSAIPLDEGLARFVGWWRSEAAAGWR